MSKTNEIVNKVKFKTLELSHKLPTIASTAIATGNMIVMNTVYAAGNAEGKAMVTGIVDMAGFIALILGIIYGIFGFIHYTAANSDGDGPAKKKAQNELASAVMLALAGIILQAVTWENLVPSGI